MSYFSKTAATVSRSGVPFRVSGPSSSGSEGMVLTGHLSNPPDPLARLLALPSPRNGA